MGWDLAHISQSNLFFQLLYRERYSQKCQAFLGQGKPCGACPYSVCPVSALADTQLSFRACQPLYSNQGHPGSPKWVIDHEIWVA